MVTGSRNPIQPGQIFRNGGALVDTFSISTLASNFVSSGANVEPTLIEFLFDIVLETHISPWIPDFRV
jgi:hypothetical protein